MDEEFFIGKSAIYDLEIGRKAQLWHPYEGFSGETILRAFCEALWEEVTGMRLMPGELWRVRIRTLKKGKGFQVEFVERVE